ncbi:MAG: phage holin family protein [Cyanobacteria bacterium SZAS LIN-2]|nr:phage holin family protein [Cyanobacteria bacterium SZAS LIN-3]MBS1996899.1 phage holin family protein [Cyanobacteria bacterium SZAS LIN-2]
MIRFALRVLVIAFLLAYVVPFIVPGVMLHGSFWPNGVICGIVFACLAFLTAVLALLGIVLTAGLGAIVVYLGFWMLNAVALMWTAHLAPSLLSVDGWGSAIGAGLIILVVNMVIKALGSSK